MVIPWKRRWPRRSGVTSSVTSVSPAAGSVGSGRGAMTAPRFCETRSEEHTSELQSRGHLVCRLLLEKKRDGPVVDVAADFPEEFGPRGLHFGELMPAALAAFSNAF